MNSPLNHHLSLMSMRLGSACHTHCDADERGWRSHPH
jgi:hypothetical protein